MAQEVETPMQDTGYCECGCGERTQISPVTTRRYGYVKGQPRRFVFGHKGRKTERHEVRDCGYETPCWIWLLSQTSNGYGQTSDGHGGKRPAHRFYYEQRVGPIPQGLVLDHLCRVPLCVNPAHLEPVTHAENVRRGLKGRLVTHCANGHEYTPANTYLKTNGCRACRACHREREAARRQRLKASWAHDAPLELDDPDERTP